MIEYQILKEEIETDPIRLGYKDGEKLKDVKQIAEIMNTVPASPVDGVKKSVDVLLTSDVLSAVVSSEYDALSPTVKTKFQALVSVDLLDVSKPTAIQFLYDIFGSATVTRSNINALLAKPESRAVVLFGEKVGYWDVARALGGVAGTVSAVPVDGKVGK